MLRLCKYSTLFLATLILGLSLAYWARPTTLSAVGASPKSYEGRTVRLKTYLSKSKTNVIACESFDGWVNFWSLSAEKHDREFVCAGLELSNTAQPELLPEDVAPNGPFYLTEAVIEGYLEPRSFDSTNCGVPDLLITNARIEKVYQTHSFAEFEDLYTFIKLNSF